MLVSHNSTDGTYTVEARGHLCPVSYSADTRQQAMVSAFNELARQQRVHMSEHLGCCSVCLRSDCEDH